MIVISDGTPDDLVITLLAHKVNGGEVVGVAKPEEKRFGALKAIPTYAREGIERILFMIDQESDTLSDLERQVKNSLKDLGVVLSDVERGCEGRLLLSKFRHQGREGLFVVVVNGLDDVRTKKHCVEDHLVMAAELLSIPTRVDEPRDSKTSWNQLEGKEKVLEKMVRGSLRLDEVFPQHMEGLCILESGIPGVC